MISIGAGVFWSVLLVAIVWYAVKLGKDLSWCIEQHYKNKMRDEFDRDERLRKLEKELFELRQREIRRGKP